MALPAPPIRLPRHIEGERGAKQPHRRRAGCARCSRHKDKIPLIIVVAEIAGALIQSKPPCASPTVPTSSAAVVSRRCRARTRHRGPVSHRSRSATAQQKVRSTWPVVLKAAAGLVLILVSAGARLSFAGILRVPNNTSWIFGD